MTKKEKDLTLTLEVATAQLRRVALREIPVRRTAQFNNVNRSYVTSDGWEFVIFNDSEEMDYLKSMLAPDGRTNTFDGWHGSDPVVSGMNPHDQQSGSELKKLAAAIDWSGTAEKTATTGTGDLFVPLGNLGGKTIKHLREVLDRGDDTVMRNYEELVEDIIGNFNHAVTQGVPPEWVLFAFTQAYAVTLGACLRANLPYTEAAKFLRVIIENAQMSKDMIQQVTTILTDDPRKP